MPCRGRGESEGHLEFRHRAINVGAIGTGRNAEPSDAGEVIQIIRSTLADIYSQEVAQKVRVQYGGSVKPGNIRDFMAHPEVDGALVGGASLDPEEFALIVKYR